VDEFTDRFEKSRLPLIGERGSEAIWVGQRQRIAIARGGLGQPKIFNLDEATSIDTGKEALIQKSLATLTEDELPFASPQIKYH